jgi:DNA-binding NtrC family response regulator
LIGRFSPKEVPNKKFHAAFVDMHLTGNLERAEGVEVIRSLRDSDPHLEIVAISGDLDRDLMEKCLKAGASRFLSKPLNADEFLLTLDKIEAHILLQGATSRSKQSHLRWVGSSETSQKIRRQIADLKGENGPILIEGESGTGKEVTAALIHEQEGREPLITINVAAIPDNLFESEFFGHTKGAFTGADQNKMGLAEAAHGGDLFLDEVEALSPQHQAKLLRFLETGEVRRLGSKDSIKVQTRVIAATNQKLEKLVKENKFREDLLWRLNGKKISLPALRERIEDVKELSEFFLALDKVRKKTLSEDAVEALRNYSWPGNVRELKRVCEQLLISAPLPIVRAQDIISLLQPSGRGGPNANVDYSLGLEVLMNEYESRIITQCLENISDIDEAGKLLGISRSSLYKKIKDHNIKWRES